MKSRDPGHESLLGPPTPDNAHGQIVESRAPGQQSLLGPATPTQQETSHSTTTLCLGDIFNRAYL